MLETFNKYFPIIVLLICLATLFRVYQRALEFFDAPQFQFDDDFHHDNIETGRDLLIRERARLARRTGPKLGDSAVARDRPHHAHKNSDAETRVIYLVIEILLLLLLLLLLTAISQKLVADSWQEAERQRENASEFPSIARIISRVKGTAEPLRNSPSESVQYGTSL